MRGYFTAITLASLSACTTIPPGTSTGHIIGNPRCLKHCQSVIVTQPIDRIGVEVENDSVVIDNPFGY